MWKFATAVLLIFSIWMTHQGIRINRTAERTIADLEYVIQTGEHCVSVCVEQFEKMGC